MRQGEKLKPNMKKIVRCYHVVNNPRGEIKEAIVINQVIYRSPVDTAPERVDDPGLLSLNLMLKSF